MSDANDAINYIYHHAPIYALAQGNHDRLSEYRKTKKSLLVMQRPESSFAMKEAWAYAHPEYIELLDEIQKYQIEAITEKLQIEAAKLRVEVYRTDSANNRRMDRAAQ